MVAAADRLDHAHELAVDLVTEYGEDFVIPLPIVVEVDQLLRARVGPKASRAFLASLLDGKHEVADLSVQLLRRAVDLDVRFADLNLGLADTAVMAVAEHHDLSILTFDFTHFRATRPAHGTWRLVVDESRYAEETGGR